MLDKAASKGKPRKPYVAPKLVHFGSARLLTRAGSAPMTEFFMGPRTKP